MNVLTANVQTSEDQMLFFAEFLGGRINNLVISKEQRSMDFIFEFDIFTFFGVRKAGFFNWRIHISFMCHNVSLMSLKKHCLFERQSTYSNIAGNFSKFVYPSRFSRETKKAQCQYNA
jgi:hypothetical protein